MIKRIIPLVAVLSLLVAMLVVPASAETVGRWEVLDYRDFIVSEDYTDGRNVYHVKIPSEYGGLQLIDIYGNRMAPMALGTTLTLNYCEDASVGLYMPAGYTGMYVMSADNIPSGSVYTGNVSLLLHEPEPFGQFTCVFRSRIAYYDENMQYISNTYSPKQEVILTDEMYEHVFEYTTTVTKPVGTRYMVFYWICNIERPNVNDRTKLQFQYSEPLLTIDIDSAYIEQQKADQIINGTVDPETPDGAGSVGDLDDIEGGLKDDTAAGRDEADEIFNESSGIVASHISGFLFLSNVIERMISVGWLRGILVVSLSLGILGFLANITMIMGRNGRDAQSSRSHGKGGKP